MACESDRHTLSVSHSILDTHDSVRVLYQFANFFHTVHLLFYSVYHSDVYIAMNRIIHYVQGWLFLLRAPVKDWLVGNPSFDSFRLRRLSYRTAAGGDEKITYRTKPNQKTGWPPGSANKVVQTPDPSTIF